MAIPLKNFKMLTIPLYDGKTDLVGHMRTYRTWMNIAKVDTSTMCNAFPVTMSRLAQAWFGRLRAGQFPTSSNLRNSSLPNF